MSTIPPIQPGMFAQGLPSTSPSAAAPHAPRTVAGSTRPMSNSGVHTPGRIGGTVSDVAQLLQGVGSGGGDAQNNQIVQMLIALVIFMALLQAAQQGGSQSAQDTLGMLGKLADNSGSGANGGNQAAMYVEQTTISMTSTQIVAAFQPVDPSASAAGGTLDLQA